MYPRLIGICGRAGSGKDTLAAGLKETFTDCYREYHIHHLADPIKHALNVMFGWQMSDWDDRIWKEEEIDWLGRSPRYLAQTLGTEWGRDLVHPELWLKIAQKEYRRRGFMIVPDVRFENEAKWISEEGVLIQVDRPSGDEITSSHPSENVGSLLSYVQFVVLNDRTPDDMVKTALRGLR